MDVAYIYVVLDMDLLQRYTIIWVGNMVVGPGTAEDTVFYSELGPVLSLLVRTHGGVVR
jgi:hypothetical protein